MKIGTTEILLILIIALFVIGPDRLPEFTQKLGKGLRQFRKFSSEATKEIRENVVEPLNEAQKPLREAVEPVTELGREVSNDVNSIRKSFTDLNKPLKTAPPETKSEKSVSGTDSEPEDSDSGTESQTKESASETT